MIDDAELIARLRDADLLSDPKLDEARDLQEREGRTLYEVLIAHQFVEESRLVEIVSEVLNVAAVDPRQFEPAGEILERVPAEVALDNWALPLETEQTDGDARLVLAMRDPIDMFAMDEIAGHTDIDIRPVLAGPRALHDALVANYGEAAELEFETPFETADEAASSGEAAGGDRRDSGREWMGDGTGEPDSDSWPSVDESNPNETHPGLVTSNISDVEESDDEQEADDGDEEVDAAFDAPLTGSRVGDPNSSPVPTEHELTADSEPGESALEAGGDDGAIGRIPVKRVPASELDDDSSMAEAGEEESPVVVADGGSEPPSDSPDGSSGPIELGAGSPADSSDNASNDADDSGDAIELGDGSPPPDSSDDSPNDSDDSGESGDAIELGDGSPPPDSSNDSDDSGESGDAIELGDGSPPPDSSSDAPNDPDDSPADSSDDSGDAIELGGEPPPPEAHDSSMPGESDGSQPSHPGRDADDSDADSSLSNLRRKLRGDEGSSPGERNRKSLLAERLVSTADELDDALEERLRTADHGELLEAAVVALVERGLLSLEELADALDE